MTSQRHRRDALPWFFAMHGFTVLHRKMAEIGRGAAYMGFSTSNSSIKLQLLLRREWRSPQGVDKVRGLLPSLGITPTIGGVAAISAEIEPEKFKDLFGVTATETAPRPPGERDFGQSGGNISPDLKVPEPLSEFVESISAAPGHIYLKN
jgi:hypothetical protein